jgi:hypothetical protein
MLEEAYFYNGMVARTGGLRTWAGVQAAEQKLRQAASNKRFPQLLDEVKKRLTSPLHYERELLSLQDVRNCLEHREGIVRERDVRNSRQVASTGRRGDRISTNFAVVDKSVVGTKRICHAPRLMSAFGGEADMA